MMTKNNFFVSITIIDFQIFVWSDWRTNKREVEFEKVTRGLLKLNEVKSRIVNWKHQLQRFEYQELYQYIQAIYYSSWFSVVFVIISSRRLNIFFHALKCVIPLQGLFTFNSYYTFYPAADPLRNS